MSDQALRQAEARIHEMDRALAPGSETAILGHALRDLRDSGDVTTTLAWWTGAYRLLAHFLERPDPDYDPVAHILEWGDDLTGWTPPPPTPDDLREWRDAEGLTQERAAEIAGVQRLAWARWELGERSVPQWLGDVLRQRWGTAP